MRPKYFYVYNGVKPSYRQAETTKKKFQRWKLANGLRLDSLITISIEFGKLAKFYIDKELIFETQY